MFDPKVKVERAKEPSLYIWENLALSPQTVIINKIFVFVILGFLMGFAYKYQGTLIKANQG